MLNALKIPRVTPVLALYALDVTLEFALAVVLMVLVFGATGNAALVALMLCCKQVVPGAVTAATGLGLERVPPRRTLGLVGILRLTGLLAIALAPIGPVTFVGAALVGFGGTAARTLLRALLAEAAGPAFRQASAVLNSLFSVICIVAPLLGAAMVAASSPRTGLLLCAGVATFVALAALWTTRVPFARLDDLAQPAADDEATPSGDARRARRLLVVAAVATFAFSMDEPALLAYVERALGGGTAEYGWLLAAWGAGMFLGGALYSRISDGDMATIFAVGVVISALGYLGMAAAPTLLVAYAFAAAGGIGNGLFSIALIVTSIEAATGSATRASARVEFVTTAAPAVGMIAGGVFAEFVSLRGTLAVPGIATLLAIAIWALVERRITRPAAIAGDLMRKEAIA